MILNEVREHKRNIFTMWFDYKKAFDSIPHQWLLEELKLAKLPAELIKCIETLTKKWATNITLQTEKERSVPNLIRYLTDILQCDSMSLILFVLCVNPLSHLLNKGCDGYMIGPNLHRSTKITHLLFVDDLKTYAKSKEVAESQLHFITEFSRDIVMEFGTDKCAYLYIEKGQGKYLNQNISINNLELQELKDDEPYKYLGRDEDITYVGELNKETCPQRIL